MSDSAWACGLSETIGFEDVHPESDLELVQDFLLDRGTAGDDLLHASAQLVLYFAEDAVGQEAVLDDARALIVAGDLVEVVVEYPLHDPVRLPHLFHDGGLHPHE